MHHARTSWLWVAAVFCWFGVLYYLSSGPIPVEDGPDVPQLDKLLHFTYFAGGGTGLHLALRYRNAPQNLQSPVSRILIVTLIIALCGWFDEWHQSWIPERSGNDPFDWLADVLGGFASYWIHRPIAYWLDSRQATSPTSLDSD